MWVSDLARALGREFFLRYRHDHKSRQVLSQELMYPPPGMYDLPHKWTPPPLAMPDEYKSDDPIESYRRYYASKSATMPLQYWRGAMAQPLWLSDLLADAAVVA